MSECVGQVTQHHFRVSVLWSHPLNGWIDLTQIEHDFRSRLNEKKKTKKNVFN
jgi:hypothetical protein